MTVTTSAKQRSRVRPAYEANPVVYWIMKCMIKALMCILYRYETTGGQNVPEEGAAILAVNHLHLFDPGAVAPAAPRRIVTLAAGKWRKNWFIRTFMHFAGAIFVNRGEVDREALRACLDVLSRGGVLAVAPEGTRTKTGGLQRAKPGIAYMATKDDTLIVPVAFWGIEKIGDWKRLKRPRCTVVIGRPFRLPLYEKKPSLEALQHLADLVMIKIGLLLPESYRGVYAERIAAVERGESDELDVLRPQSQMT